MSQELDKEQMPPPSSTTASGKTTPKEAKKPETKVDIKEEDAKKATPAVVRTRQFRGAFQSPSDAVMSPFSQTLNKAIHHPALLKKSQKPKRLQQISKEKEGPSDK